MLRGGIPIGRLFGISLRLHYSWFAIFVLVTWALAANYFPTVYPAWNLTARIAAGSVARSELRSGGANSSLTFSYPAIAGGTCARGRISAATGRMT